MEPVKKEVTVFLEVPENFGVPHWADKHLGGDIELYAQLATRDGRRFGNGLVVEVHDEDELLDPQYVVLTDFGNEIKLSAKQLEDSFYPPIYRMKKHLAEYRRGAMEAYLLVERSVAF